MNKLKKTYIVKENMTARHFASGTLDVFATPSMVGCMEDTAKTLMDPFLQEGESSVGTFISTTHVKATAVGGEVEIEACLEKQEGRLYYFTIKATESGEIIGEGTHTRAAINIERFLNKLKK